jgi:hypothetical protein
MNLSYLSTVEGGNTLVSNLRSYFVRYRMPLYILLAAITSVSVAWNWNWLTGAEVFRILASLPCTLMMLMCIRHAACGIDRRPRDAGETHLPNAAR